ncbi:MAG: hybrid sensor histidine kinase/response regulator [Sulfuricaulis sp.]
MNSGSKHYTRWPFVIFAVAVLSTAAFTWQLRQTVQAKDQERFERQVAIAQNSLTDHISAYITLLRGAAGLFASNVDVRREELRAYVERLDLKRYPGVLGIGWSLRIPASNKNNVITAMRNQWSPSFDIWPQGERPEYHAVLYLEPINQLKQAAIGYDMFTQQTRRAAMEHARDGGSVAASAKLMLLYEIDKQQQPGFLIYVPVYRGGTIPQTVAERRAKLHGFLYSPYHASHLISDILTAKLPFYYLSYRIFDGSEIIPDALLYQSDTYDADRVPRFTKTATIDVAGRTWTILFTSTPAFEHTMEQDLPLIVLTAGLLISLLLAGGTWRQVQARAAAEKNARALQESQHELMKQREWLQTTFNSMGDGLITTDKTGIVTYLNPAAVSLTGWTLTEARGMPLDKIFHIVDENTRVDVENPVIQILRDGKAIRLSQNTLLVAKDGTERPIDNSAALIWNQQGDIDGVVLLFHDVTRQRQAVQALEMSEIHYRSLIEISPQGVWMTNPDGALLYMNQYWLEYSGLDLEKNAREKWMEQAHPDDHERVRESWQRALASGTVYETEARFRRAVDNQYRWHLVRAAPVRDDSGRIEKWLGVVVDIHQRTQAETAMAQLGAIVESSDDAIIGMDLEGIITSWNAGAERLYGYTAEEVIAKPISILIPPGHMNEELAFLEKLRRGEGIAHCETERMRKDREILYVSLTISPIKNRAGQVIGASKVARDISERRRVERERAEALVREHALRTQAESANRAKDDFLATLSHELRTPLNAILGWIQTLNQNQVDQKTLTRGLKIIEQNARIQTTLIDDLLNVSDIVLGRLRLDIKPLNLATVIGGAVESLRPAIEAKDINFAIQLDDAAENFNGDATRIQQIIWNLVSNAVKFTPRRGQIRLTLARYEPYVEIAVEDSGAGIDPTFLPYVFHRFRQADSSSKRKHGGLGLGLAIVRHLTELHGGTVEAESPGAGQGARFTVRLPIRTLTPMEQARPAEPPVSAKTTPALAPLRRLDGLRILSVDDDRNAREMLQIALQHAGAEVISGGSAAEALVLLQRFRPDVIVSDIGLPEQDGYDLLRGVRALPPEAGGSTPAVALTGYVSAQDRLATEAAGYQAFVSKPVNLANLIDTVIRVTRGQPGQTTGEASRSEKAPS